MRGIGKGRLWAEEEGYRQSDGIDEGRRRCLQWELCYTTREQVTSAEPQKEAYRPGKSRHGGDREGKGRAEREMAGLRGGIKSREGGASAKPSENCA